MIAYDKRLHFIAGFVIAVIAQVLFGGDWGILAGISAGIAKEIKDEITYGGADWWDLAATVAGSLFGLSLLRLLG